MGCLLKQGGIHSRMRIGAVLLAAGEGRRMGGVPKALTTARAARVLKALRPAGAVETARCELAADLLDDLRRIDARMRETRTKLAAAVAAAGTSLTGLFGVGPVIAAAVIGDVRDVSRFPGRDHFAAYNGTAPIEVSSGQRKTYRLSRRGNRRLNHAIHMAAVTQIRNKHSEGRAYFDRKLAEGKTRKEALRSLKRRVSDAVYAHLQDDARHTRKLTAREGNWGTALIPARPAHTPTTGSSDKPLPGLTPPYDLGPPPACHKEVFVMYGRPLCLSSRSARISGLHAAGRWLSASQRPAGRHGHGGAAIASFGVR